MPSLGALEDHPHVVSPPDMSLVWAIRPSPPPGINKLLDAADPAASGTPLSRWFEPLTTLAGEGKLGVAELAEEDVKAQVRNVVESTVMHGAWEKGRDVWVHGWVYEVGEGTLRDLGVSVGRERLRRE
ncbi:hypothetical protein CERSUDRAFT_100722 [Gelatoporia subvermispora B]|uniref:Carbonic anhydrase n=1 Tax=Ceriporiopsis subvermispora (strain B) TaxID=914234 RepID=M2Q2Q1_CERS8|nr:hypothetical protein CERSUDRAFT_100722 [Gelatoporia subvermispora B]